MSDIDKIIKKSQLIEHANVELFTDEQIQACSNIKLPGAQRMGKKDNYPNLQAIKQGSIAGNFREWPEVRPEVIAIFEALTSLQEKVAGLKAARDEAYETAANIIESPGWHAPGSATYIVTKKMAAKIRKLKGGGCDE